MTCEQVDAEIDRRLEMTKVPVPINGLLSKDYAAGRARAIDLDRATGEMPEPGDAWAFEQIVKQGADFRPVDVSHYENVPGVQPGQVLQLAADIESLDVEAMAYRGSATIDGTPIIRLEECLGPMIPVTDLDDPVLLRERFARQIRS